MTQLIMTHCIFIISAMVKSNFRMDKSNVQWTFRLGLHGFAFGRHWLIMLLRITVKANVVISLYWLKVFWQWRKFSTSYTLRKAKIKMNCRYFAVYLKQGAFMGCIISNKHPWSNFLWECFVFTVSFRKSNDSSLYVSVMRNFWKRVCCLSMQNALNTNDILFKIFLTTNRKIQ